MKLLRRLLLVLIPVAVLLMGVWGQAIGQAESGGVAPGLAFDHAQTGFLLDNAHKAVACESCHTSATFRGTPKTCATCHAGPGARAPGKLPNHIQTGSIACDTCHATTNWQSARMNHNAVTTVACSVCHDGKHADSNALGKSVSHVPTLAACNTCHLNSTVFSPATMSHAGTAGQCNSCHSGAFVSVNAQAKGASHVTTTAQCDQCHPTTVSWYANAFDHVATPPVDGRCADCHNGSRALGKSVQHLPTTVQCDSCHKNTTTFTGAQMNHAGTGGACSTCHGGSFTSINALTKPLTHVSTTAQCDSCHSNTASWLGAKFDHATVSPAVAGRCATCHNGSTALGMPSLATHIPTSASCDVCHTGYAAFTPARMNHSGTTGPAATANCSTCHGGAYVSSNAQKQSATHINDARQCDTCHTSTISWATATWAHDPANVNCSGCHNNSPTVGMPTTHIPTSAQCSNCHKNFVSFRPAAMDHSGLTNCTTCHGGGYKYVNAKAKSTSHIPTTAECSTCHNGFSVFAPATMNHASTAGPVVAGNCLTCHNGTFAAANAVAKPVSHIPTGTQSCDSCHGTSAWKPTSYSHTGVVVGSCGTCHNGTGALGKSAKHLPTSVACDVCHTNFSSFSPARMNHAGTANPSATIGSSSCSTCHGGAYISINAQVKPSTHVATNAQCDTCHTSNTTWATATFVHDPATVPGLCSTCHNGTPVLGKPTTHIPTTAQCDTCHSSSNFTGFRSNVTMSHTGTTGPVAPGNCSSCHGGNFLYANALGKNSNHVATNAQCDTCHTGGYVSWAGATFIHSASATGACSTCHNGTIPKAYAKPNTHIPTTAQCDTCHGNYTSFKPAAMNHTGTSAQCATCHSGGFTSVNALAKPVTHIPTGAQCDTCHNNGFISFVPSPMNHSATMTPVAAGNCSTCHGDTAPYLIYNAQHKSANHVNDSRQCDTCHTSTTTWATARYTHLASAVGTCDTCHKPTGSGLPKSGTHIPTTAQCDTCHNSYVAFSPATMSHTGTANNCLSCHNGAYSTVNAQARSAKHIPTGTQSCDGCHGTVAWKPTTYAHSGVVAGTCGSCHNGTNALTKSASHLPTTGNACDDCHKNYAAFVPAKMNHLTGSVAVSGNCSTCHSGAYLSINAQIKSPTHIADNRQCDTCHTSTSTWATATFAHDSNATGKCSNCHNGTNALGKPTTHVPTTAQCDSCHKNYSSFRPATMNHTGTVGPLAVGNCSTCHAGAFVSVNAQAKPATHIPVTGQCDTCHTKGYSTWSPATMSHSGLTNCATCHSGAYLLQNAQIKPATHVPTTAQCSSCHSSTSSWATVAFNHTGNTAACSTCHNGTQALGKPTNHIPTTASCDTCHTNFTAFNPAAMSHVSTLGPVAAGNCSTCHSGTYVFANAQAKSVNHVVTSAQCDTCHNSTVSWVGASYAHNASAAGTCSTCHNGATALGKPSSTHIPTSAQCDTCHSNFTAFKPAKMNHAGTAAQCSTCHSGGYVASNAQAKPLSHIPTASQCDTCHNSGFVSFMPSQMNHSATSSPVAAGNCSTCHGDSAPYLVYNAQHKSANHVNDSRQCDTCHTSTTTWATAKYTHLASAVGTCDTCHKATGSGLPKPSTHIPTTAQCDTCHNSYVAFSPATMSHTGTAGNCLSCHNGGYTTVNAQVRPANHIPTGSRSCDECHGTVVWKPATYNHSGVAAGSCATCHNGTLALNKSASHLPTNATCDTCHTNFVAFAPAKMNHAGTNTPVAANNCSTCHSGSYLTINAQVKPATHVTTSAQCDTCHKSTVSWATATFVHDANTVGKCSTCHNGTTALAKPTTHIPTTAQCDTCHKNTTSFRPASMSHTATTGPVATGNCSTCHGGAYVAVNALAKPNTHIPVTAQCDSCHNKGYVSWAPATMSHTGLTSCTTCHSGAYVAQNAQIKPATHIVTTAQCSTCHNSTTTWATGTFNHSGVVAGSCATCHNGTNALGKPNLHIPTTATCDTCHKNYTSFNPATMTHNGVTTPNGGCATCHNGAYTAAGALGKNVAHIPTTQSCNICHTTSAWKPTTFSHTGITAACSSCHNGTAAQGKPTVHIPIGAKECNLCHRTGLAWLPLLTYSHTETTNCTSCHLASYPGMDVKLANHVPTTSGCEICHTTTAWSPMKKPYAHTGVVSGTCATCHTGNYTGVLGKPSNHIPTTLPAGMPGNECSLCHSSKTTFTTERMNHGTMQTSCVTCHDSTSTYLGSMDKITRGSRHHNSTGKDCSSSGCHRPLGSKGTAYSKWD